MEEKTIIYEGSSIINRYGTFESGKEYKFSKEIAEALLKIEGFSEAKGKKKSGGEP